MPERGVSTVGDRATVTRAAAKGFTGDVAACVRKLASQRVAGGSSERFDALVRFIANELSPAQAGNLLDRLRDPKGELRGVLDAKLSRAAVRRLLTVHLPAAAVGRAIRTRHDPARELARASRGTDGRAPPFRRFAGGDVEAHLSEILDAPVPAGKTYRFAWLAHFFSIELSPTQAARLLAKLNNPRDPMRIQLRRRLSKGSVPKLLSQLNTRSLGRSPTPEAHLLDDAALLRRLDELNRQTPTTHTDPFLNAEKAEVLEVVEHRRLAFTPAPPEVLDAIDRRAAAADLKRALDEATQTADYSGLDPEAVVKTAHFNGGQERSGQRLYDRMLRQENGRWVPYAGSSRSQDRGRSSTVYVDRTGKNFSVDRWPQRDLDLKIDTIFETWRLYTSRRAARAQDLIDRALAFKAGRGYPYEPSDPTQLMLPPKKPQPLVRQRNRRRMAIWGARSADDILRRSIPGLKVFWTSPTGHRVFITPTGQLVGSHRALTLQSFRTAYPDYKGWHSHHIVEEVHLKRLWIRKLFKPRDDLPAVLLTGRAHSKRIGRVLKSVNQPRGSAKNPNSITARGYFEAYQQAYTMKLDDYVGHGNARALARELMAVVSNMLGF